MPPLNYEDIEADGHIFRFFYDTREPSKLHVEVNGYTVDLAVDIFFDGGNPFWRTDRAVFETLMGNYGIWWNWIDEAQKHVRMISCFKRYQKW